MEDMHPSIPKTFAVAILAFVAYWILFVLGSVLLSVKNATGSEGEGITIARLVQDGAVSGMAAYGVLWLAEHWRGDCWRRGRDSNPR
ncbi:MAG TPA: hypothetical protein VGR65_05200 [Casimicrobiaceae bacterium]|nr:hypothetical protein [Casimicrobiaceae bacterium]